MMREERLDWLCRLRSGLVWFDVPPKERPVFEQVLSEVIKSLEQESCEDAVSREQAMAIIYKIKENHTSDRENHPINYGTLCDINLQLVNLPPVTPTCKKGKWKSDGHGHIVCTACNEVNVSLWKSKYCPCCGAEMEGEE